MYFYGARRSLDCCSTKRYSSACYFISSRRWYHLPGWCGYIVHHFNLFHTEYAEVAEHNFSLRSPKLCVQFSSASFRLRVEEFTPSSLRSRSLISLRSPRLCGNLSSLRLSAFAFKKFRTVAQRKYNIFSLCVLQSSVRKILLCVLHISACNITAFPELRRL